MFTGILTIFGGLFGAVSRFVPAVLQFFDRKADRQHELDMIDRQTALDKARTQDNIDLAHVQQVGANQIAEWSALTEANKAQMTPTGNHFIDALNASVRPVLAYWWMLLFTAYKAVLFTAAAIECYLTLKAAGFALEAMPGALDRLGASIWMQADAAILASIVSFFFVDRALRHDNGQVSRLVSKTAAVVTKQ